MDTDYRVSAIHTTRAGLVAVDVITTDWQRMHVVAPRKRTGTDELDTLIRRSIAARDNPIGARYLTRPTSGSV